eukprot:CAMPEP_0201874242 /NCGR_PEP_ID=MMETSP0902-20130614/6542_1 /ASSEMBLY_ACC=CAM_ASM_000551 /TAXON_ID=420261 /ORGANISM="Thalassiosira antarctica, Strain CCMP982" /LENGTH=641 /DNA_ID=CAMNT_0048401063 /DNA_START=78 /DNA_END=2003 /DNA_ORIENTATION=+
MRRVAQHHHATSSIIYDTSRFMSTNAPQTDGEDDASIEKTNTDPELNPSVLANIYNHQRAHYNRAVSSLRKQYFAEIAEQRERERRRKAFEEAKLKRETLERRRLKALRTAENAKKQLDKQAARRVEWERELELTQLERDAKKALYKLARQKIVDELEAECHLWLTSPEEVEKALGNPTASQILWARPGGMIGAPSGLDTGFGDFGDFWRYECHTWNASPTYKSPKEVMLEEIEDMSYLQANNNANYWTKERVEEFEKKESQARLRAIVREEGRRSLLNKQRDMMRDIYGTDQGNKQDQPKGGKLPPTAMPAPMLDYLADYEAQEREGVEIMKRDPRKFFIFESDLPSSQNLGGLHGLADSNEDGQITDSEGNITTAGGPASVGASLGRPIGLRNPFFNDKPTAFPIRMGRDMPEDTRTEKEKKRDERQERMRAAAEEAALAASKGASYEVAMAAEEDLEDGSEDVDYDQAEEDAEKELWVDQEEQWRDTDKKVFDMTPPSARLTPDDVDWVIGQLNAKVAKTTERIDLEDKIRRKEMDKALSSDTVSKPIESLDEVDRYVMEGLGYDMEAIEALVTQLTPEQSAALEDIDFTGRIGITAEEMTSEIQVVPGLTEEQVQALVGMEMSLLRDEKLKAITKMG